MNTKPSHGPIHFRAPAKILWRTIRGYVYAYLLAFGLFLFGSHMYMMKRLEIYTVFVEFSSGMQLGVSVFLFSLHYFFVFVQPC